MNHREQPPTADELREEVRRSRHSNGDRADTTGVDFEKLAAVMADPARRVAGWEAPREPPPGWVPARRYDRREPDRNPFDGSAVYIEPRRRLKAILSCGVELDGRAWLHLSVSYMRTGHDVGPKGWRLPSWGEMGIAKLAFLGDREAYMVHPPKARYVNINERVLHWWALLDETESALPDFTRGTGSI